MEDMVGDGDVFMDVSWMGRYHEQRSGAVLI